MVSPFFHMEGFPSRKVSNTANSSVLLFQQFCADYSGTGELPSLFANTRSEENFTRPISECCNPGIHHGKLQLL